MTISSGEELDLEQLKREIRAEVSEKRATMAASVRLPFVNPAEGWTFNWLEARSALRNAANVQPLDALPALDRYHGIKRRIGLAVARVVLSLIRFVLDRQAWL